MFSPAIELLHLIECQMVIGCRCRCRRRFESHIISRHENMKFNNNKGKKNAQLSIQKRETNNSQQLLEINEGYTVNALKVELAFTLN